MGPRAGSFGHPGRIPRVGLFVSWEMSCKESALRGSAPRSGPGSLSGPSDGRGTAAGKGVASQPKARSNLLLSTTQGRSDWYSCSLTARRVGLNRPRARFPHRGAARRLAGWPAASKTIVTNRRIVSVSALGTCHAWPRASLPLSEGDERPSEVLDVGDGVGNVGMPST